MCCCCSVLPAFFLAYSGVVFRLLRLTSGYKLHEFCLPPQSIRADLTSWSIRLEEKMYHEIVKK